MSIRLSLYARVDSQAIDILRSGTFVDGNGKEVTITTEDLDAFVRNFEQFAAGQEIPIDIDHEMGQAAGWLRSLERAGNMLIGIPEWNDLGKQLVGGKIYRYISATIDMAKKLIISASLVNFPAVKGLRPIELESPQTAAIQLSAADLPANTFVFTNSLQELTMTDNQEGIRPTEEVANQIQPEATSDQAQAPVQLSQADVAQLVNEQVAAQMARLRDVVAEQFSNIETLRTQVIADTLAQLREEQEMAQFSMRVTSTGRYAIPMTPQELQAKLSAIPRNHRQAVIDLLTTVHNQGTVDFSEVGTSAGKAVVQLRALEPAIKTLLTQFVAAGGKPEEFFVANGDVLGPMSDYDLTS